MLLARKLRRPLMEGSSATKAAGARAASTAGSGLRLPRLPVPELRHTLDRYMKSVEPFILDDDAAGVADADSAREAHIEIMKKYRHGIGRVAQKHLQELDTKSPMNWLDDNLWMQKAYLEWREPLVVNSNWWLALENDRTLPDLSAAASAGELSPWQIRRAAWMLHRVLDFKQQLDTQAVYPDTTRTGLWFRRAALLAFSSCRAPAAGADQMLDIPPHHTHPHRVLVMVYDWCYALDVYPDADAEHPSPDTPRVLEQRLRAIVADAQARRRAGERAVPVGVMSADHRDQWAENLEYLRALHPSNAETLRAIQQAVFAVSLDDWTYPGVPERDDAPAPPNFAGTPPGERDAHLHNTRSSHGGRNRWFDRPLTLAVESGARAGVLGEHAPVDALVPSVVAEYATVEPVDPTAFADTVPLPLAVADAAIEPVGWRRLDWVVDEHLGRECVAAEARVRKVVDDSDDSVFWFDGYGGDWIKDELKLSPDAYVQMALQLAWYQQQRCFTATYETALTRLFAHGRTETIRSLTLDSRTWVLAMVDPSTPIATKAQLLRRAVQTHESLTRDAATGRGIDRHLFGLQQMSVPNAETAQLPQSDLFRRSQTWRLSTSGLSAGHHFRGTGFGAPLHDGYGINYLTGPDLIKFGVESKHSCPTTSTSGFIVHLKSALQEMKGLFDAVGYEQSFPAARL